MEDMEKTEGGILVGRRTFLKLMVGSVAIAMASPVIQIVDRIPSRLANIYLHNLPTGWWFEMYAHTARINQTEPLFTGTLTKDYVKSQALTGSLVILKLRQHKPTKRDQSQWLTGALEPDLYDATRIDAQEFFGWRGVHKQTLQPIHRV